VENERLGRGERVFPIKSKERCDGKKGPRHLLRVNRGKGERIIRTKKGKKNKLTLRVKKGKINYEKGVGIPWEQEKKGGRGGTAVLWKGLHVGPKRFAS